MEMLLSYPPRELLLDEDWDAPTVTEAVDWYGYCRGRLRAAPPAVDVFMARGED